VQDEEAAVAAAVEALAAAGLGPAAGPGPSSAAAAASDRDAAEPAGAAGEAAGEAGSSGAAGGGGDTDLHRAARAGNVDRVARLLDAGHDPSALDARGRPPYALAADKHTRDAFRRFMAAHPDR
jgi:hypothetical protein